MLPKMHSFRPTPPPSFLPAPEDIKPSDKSRASKPILPYSSMFFLASDNQ